MFVARIWITLNKTWIFFSISAGGNFLISRWRRTLSLSILLLRHGSYERSAQALRCGIVATDVRADQPLQRERARGHHGRCCSFVRQGRDVGLEAAGGARETRGRQPESPERENGSPAHVEGVDLPKGTKGFTQLENRPKGQGIRWVTALAWAWPPRWRVCSPQ